jgi:hypothetical protein
MKLVKASLLFLAIPLLAATDPFVGTWKLDTGKTKVPPGAPSFLMATIKIEESATGLKSTAFGADGQGIASSITFDCSLDSKPCPVTTATQLRGESAIDTITLHRIDPRTIDATGTLSGKQVYSDRRVVAADGSTLTVTRKGNNSAGKAYQSTIVLTRQK